MQRSRERGSFYPSVSTVKWWYTTNGGPIVYTNGPSTRTSSDIIGEKESMTDFVTPNFRERLEAGEIINNPMTKFSEKVTMGDQGFYFSKAVGSTTYYGEWTNDWMPYAYGVPSHPPDESLVNLHSEVATKVRSKVLQPSAQTLVTAAELKKSLQMLRRPLTSLSSSFLRSWRFFQRKGKYRTTNRGRNLSPAELKSVFVNTWMEGRYGWRPLFYEVNGILEALNTQIQERYTVRSGISDTFSYTRSSVGTISGITIPYTTKTLRKVRVSAGIIYKYHEALDDYVWGTRLSDIPVAAWDLVPLSFVVDWFVNVNTFLQAVTPKSGVETLAAWTKEEIETSSLRTTSAASFSDWVTLRSPSAQDLRVSKSTRRSPVVNMPTLALRTNSLLNVATDFRGLDTIALLLQRVKL